MKTALLLASAAIALSASLVGPVALASADPDTDTSGSAEDTIAGLQLQGYTVHVDRVGSAPLSDCWVTNVRNPQEQWVTRHDNDGDEYEVLVSKTIIVSLAC